MIILSVSKLRKNVHEMSLISDQLISEEKTSREIIGNQSRFPGLGSDRRKANEIMRPKYRVDGEAIIKSRS